MVGKSRINKPTSTMKATQTTNKEFFLRTANAIIILALTTCFVFQVSDQVKFYFLKKDLTNQVIFVINARWRNSMRVPQRRLKRGSLPIIWSSLNL